MARLKLMLYRNQFGFQLNLNKYNQNTNRKKYIVKRVFNPIRFGDKRF